MLLVQEAQRSKFKFEQVLRILSFLLLKHGKSKSKFKKKQLITDFVCQIFYCFVIYRCSTLVPLHERCHVLRDVVDTSQREYMLLGICLNDGMG